MKGTCFSKNLDGIFLPSPLDFLIEKKNDYSEFKKK